jgi:dienelactone hydrolase
MFICVLLLLGVLWADGDVVITGSRGQSLELAVAGTQPDAVRPCLILAPGRGYHKDLPILTDLAQQAAVANEQADLFDVIDYAKSMSGVDSTTIVLAGKSLGSVVAWWVFQKAPALAGVILLTPVMATEEMGEQYYHHLQQETRPVTIIVGAQDADNCPLPVLYDFLGARNSTIPVVVVPGDHGLNRGPWDDASWVETNNANIHAANSAAVMWLKTYVQP